MGCCVGGGWRQAGLVVGWIDGFEFWIDGLTIVINWVWKSVKGKEKGIKRKMEWQFKKKGKEELEKV